MPTPTRGALYAAHEHIDNGSHQGDEQHHPDVDHHPPGYLAVQVLVNFLPLPAGLKEEQDRPGKRHADQKHHLPAGEGSTLHRHAP
jgi:hypothetical protein